MTNYIDAVAVDFPIVRKISLESRTLYYTSYTHSDHNNCNAKYY